MPAANKVIVHDGEIDSEYLEANVVDCRDAEWQRARWTAAGATPLHSSSGAPADHSHCQICWWTLFDSPDLAHRSATLMGHAGFVGSVTTGLSPMRRQTPNQAMQLTASKPAVYASCGCRRDSILRGMHRGLAAADLVSR